MSGEEILWPGKYRSMDDIEEERRKAANEFAWEREYLLNIVPAEDQVIDPAWIQFYDEVPKPKRLDTNHCYTSYIEVRIGIDLAISKRDTADFTAMVPAVLYETEYGQYDIYILPKIINKRLSFPETIEICKTLNDSYKKIEGWSGPMLVIEDVAYQRALPQQLREEGLRNVQTIRPGSSDKRTRLMLTANWIKTGRIKFPRSGADELIQQIVHFGVEKYDDLADAFSTVILSAISKPPVVPRIYTIRLF
jgi:predicted phage terminase large subunit-like protein